jgi:hypothetical protein
MRKYLAPVLLLALALMLPSAARADDTTPTNSKFGGGCWKTQWFGEMCASPDISIAVVSFRSDGPAAGVMPGAGYKVEAWTEQWYTVGVGGYINVQTGSAHNGMATFQLSFAQYIRAGMAHDLYAGPGNPWYPVLGLGMDFGPIR